MLPSPLQTIPGTRLGAMDPPKSARGGDLTVDQTSSFWEPWNRTDSRVLSILGARVLPFGSESAGSAPQPRTAGTEAAVGCSRLSPDREIQWWPECFSSLIRNLKETGYQESKPGFLEGNGAAGLGSYNLSEKSGPNNFIWSVWMWQVVCRTILFYTVRVIV